MNIVTSLLSICLCKLTDLPRSAMIREVHCTVAGLTGLLFSSAQCCVSHVVLIECSELNECT